MLLILFCCEAAVSPEKLGKNGDAMASTRQMAAMIASPVIIGSGGGGLGGSGAGVCPCACKSPSDAASECEKIGSPCFVMDKNCGFGLKQCCC
ncbi:hypothetical protein FGB62_58g020 [Gracilaria domingensis]|nr:hypothetical protein FGB62_58g020 [Gracilaria domingensis]